MIGILLLECAVMCPDGITRDRFHGDEGWTVERLGECRWRVRQAANEPQNIHAVMAFILEGYAGVYVEEPDAPEERKQQEDHQPKHRDGAKGGKARKAGRGHRVQQGAQRQEEGALTHPLDTLNDKPVERPELL